MRTLYIDCGMGAAGDMLSAALLELFSEEERTEIVEELNNLGIPGVRFTAQHAEKCGIGGTHMKVTVDGCEEGEHMHEHDADHHHEDEQTRGGDHHHGGESQIGDHVHVDEEGHEYHHSHSSMHGIEHIVQDHLSVSDKVKKDIMAVYAMIAEAESHVHGVPVEDIHFHEVGTMDAVADVTAVCFMMDRLAPEKVAASPVHVGAGTVKCAHGILPVPAPATAYILEGVPIYGGRIQSELCTPTGAALLKYFVSSFGDMPVMQTEKIGYGMGKKDFERANCVRAILGKSGEDAGVVAELSCNIDDMTAEEIGHAMDVILKEGALEVYTVPVGMKKCRPGTLLCVMCREADKEKILQLIFRHTTTLGIRENISKRYTLERRMETIETPFGPVRKKVSSGYGAVKEKLEYDDLARISKETGKSLAEIRNSVK